MRRACGFMACFPTVVSILTPISTNSLAGSDRSQPMLKREVTTQTLQQHDALAYAIELGYTFDHDWKPRASVFYGYGTGDKNGVDNNNQRFDAFYGFNQPWSRNDYFSWDNIHAPKTRLEFVPYKDVRVDTGFNAYWLESDTGAWTRANLQDRTGKSGSFLGYEWDLRLRHKLNPYVDWSMSYAYFSPGDFTRAQNNEQQRIPAPIRRRLPTSSTSKYR